MRKEKTWKGIIAFGLSLYSNIGILAVTTNLYKGELVHEDLAAILLSVCILVNIVAYILLTWPNKQEEV